ncbi:SGNH/GDSL hydrolase family protein [Mucilaginibacter celer]|uniref:Acetyl xylan esterase n=1 Tax=Mucilaginibacter celer TaxID=2305508 RepID=A0A494VUD9_9SPHI|nr:SGNH/GDSL hydrolase family protein [Mucilaginibacter celer]AYL98584.1 acetyl xylan esterase [Mucilaginibacter celer]
MKHYVFLLFILFSKLASAQNNQLRLFTADNPLLKYVGRFEMTNPRAPRVWTAGAYMLARFKGKQCEVLVNDEVMYGKSHNYLEIVVNDKRPYRIKTTGKTNVIAIPDSLLNDGANTLLICKDTETHIGYIEFAGIRCAQLLPLKHQSKHKIEYFGDSITSGAGMDLSAVPCDKGEWYDQHNAYMSYGARTSRNLDAEWQLTSVAGIGLVHSCCDMKVVMPQVYDKLYLRNDSLAWDFKRYRPDVVTVCLGQNDGVQDSTLFCSTYVKFIDTLRAKYPDADIVCLTSPMADAKLTAVLQRYLTTITAYVNNRGDKKVSRYFFSCRYWSGCGTHPDLAEHELIANELTAYIKRLKGW